MSFLSVRASLAMFFLCFLGLGLALSERIRTQFDAELGETLKRDTDLLVELSGLRVLLHRLEHATDQYRLTRRPFWLNKRRSLLAQIRRCNQKLLGLFAHSREHGVMRELDRQVSSRVREQAAAIASSLPGAVQEASAAGAERREAIGRMIDILGSMRELQSEELEARQREARRSSRRTLLGVLVLGMVSSLILGGLLVLLVVRPLSDLEQRLRQWRFGGPWSGPPLLATRRIQRFAMHLELMARRMNRRLEVEQARAQLKTELVALVSHEFNNALTVIQNAAQLLGDGGLRTDERTRFHQILQSNVRNLSLAARNIINMGRLDSGRWAISPKATRLQEVIEQGLARLQLLAQRKELRVVVELPDDPVVVWADPEALALVVSNLMSNAIKYSSPKGTISIGLRADAAKAGRAVVEFQDSGIGIAPEDQVRLGDNFFRTEAGKKSAPGFGLGLWLVRKVLEAHDSRLEIESEPGQGSRFSFGLAPCEPLPEPAAPAAPSGAAAPVVNLDRGSLGYAL